MADSLGTLVNDLVGTKTTTQSTVTTAPPSNTSFYIVVGVAVLAVAGLIYWYLNKNKG